MSCWKVDIQDSFGYYGEFTDPQCLREFYSYVRNIVKYNPTVFNSKKKILLYFSNIDYVHLSKHDLSDLMYYYGSNTNHNIAMIFSTKLELPLMYKRSFSYY